MVVFYSDKSDKRESSGGRLVKTPEMLKSLYFKGYWSLGKFDGLKYSMPTVPTWKSSRK